jgi:pyruvate dehydrogenase E2 component (dihydrolipoamide acetyltransferase)
MIEFRMPSLGADMDAGTLREWKVKPGDSVRRGDIIAEVEIQKGVVEIEIFDEGVVEKLLIDIDEKVPVGTVIALINDGKDLAGNIQVEEVAPPIPEAEIKEPEPPVVAQKEVPVLPDSAPEVPHPVAETNRVRATPLARRMAEDLHVDLRQLKGTGETGVITKEDVEHAASGTQAIDIAAPAPPASVTTAPLKKPSAGVDHSAIRKAVAAAMGKSNREIPHYYIESVVDMTKPLAWLSTYNKKQPPRGRLLPVVLMIKAMAKALEEVPELNAIWDDGLHLREEIHVGFVVSLKGGGIIVPAIHDANRRTLPELMALLNDLIPRARALRLRSSELSDSTVTLTSLGDNAADKVYGVIYPPQVAIIGLGSIIEAPFAENGMLAVRQVMHVTLAGDHRASDGLSGSRFLQAFKKHLQNPETL